MLGISITNNQQMLKHVLLIHVGILWDELQTHALTYALKTAGVTCFLRNLISLSEFNILQLKVPAMIVPDPTTANPDRLIDYLELTIPITLLRKLIISLLCWNHYSRQHGKAADVCTITKAMYDEFCISSYDHNQPIVPWKLKLPSELNAEANWLKTMKPSKTDYKPFFNNKNWILAKESLETTVESHNLENMLKDPSFMPIDSGLDNQQHTWFYKVLQDCMKAPMAKQIVLKYKDSKDARTIWKEIKEHYDDNMAMKICSQELHKQLNGVKLATKSIIHHDVR